VKKILEGEREEKELVQQELNQERSFSMENISTISPSPLLLILSNTTTPEFFVCLSIVFRKTSWLIDIFK
jgi:hypothetical protein